MGGSEPGAGRRPDHASSPTQGHSPAGADSGYAPSPPAFGPSSTTPRDLPGTAGQNGRTGLIRVSAVIPAYNEATRIHRVLETVLQSGAADEVLVISDGSTDNTVEVAASVDGVQVIGLTRNRGKAFALREGARRARGDVLLFLDADLIGLKPDHVCRLTAPVLNGSAGMALGIFGGGRFWTDLAQKIAPNISGQRALRKDLFLSVPDLENCGFGVEVAVTGYVRARGARVERVSFAGVTHPTKEEKLGFWRGEWERMKMYAQILAYKLTHLWREHRARRIH